MQLDPSPDYSGSNGIQKPLSNGAPINEDDDEEEDFLSKNRILIPEAARLFAPSPSLVQHLISWGIPRSWRLPSITEPRPLKSKLVSTTTSGRLHFK